MAWLTHTRSSHIASSKVASKLAPQAVGVPSPFDALKSVWARWARRLTTNKDRAAVMVLLKADDRLLADMGISRDDVRHVLATKENPSLALQKIAERRRKHMVI